MKIALNKLIGMTEEKSEELVKRWGLRCRIVEKDGVPTNGDCRYNLCRINLRIKNNIVTECYLG